jgi:choline monooxygenase
MAAEYFWIFPNWMLNCYPDNVSLNIVLPTCVAIFEWYFPADRLVQAEQTMKFSDEIQIEDGHICEVAHKNLKSSSYDRGRYSAKQEKRRSPFPSPLRASHGPLNDTSIRARLQSCRMLHKRGASAPASTRTS